MVLFGILGWLYYLGQSNPGAKLALVSVAALYSLTIHIVVTIAAFRESVGTGFLTLCVPFYAIYFVFKISESNLLQLLYTTAFVINLILRFTDK